MRRERGILSGMGRSRGRPPAKTRSGKNNTVGLLTTTSSVTHGGRRTNISVATSVTMRIAIYRHAQTVQSSSQRSLPTLALYEIKPWIQKAWFDVIKKIHILCHQVERAVRVARMLKYLEATTPTLVSHVRALTDKEDLGDEELTTPCTYPVSRPSGTKFPNKPEDCQHGTEHQYRHGNAAGSFLECRACGAAWKPRSGPIQ